MEPLNFAGKIGAFAGQGYLFVMARRVRGTGGFGTPAMPVTFAALRPPGTPYAPLRLVDGLSRPYDLGQGSRG
jgi:hypothetical protein